LDSVRPTTGRTRLFEHRSSSRVQPVNAGSASYYNLKIHCDGSNIKETIRAACPGQEKAISSGAKLPLTAAQANAQDQSQSEKKNCNTIVAYTTNGRFDNNTFNKLMVFWLIQHSLPWVCFEDKTLCITLNYLVPHTKLNSQTWAATTAHSLNLSLQRGVMDDIKASST
jgi:hypothetical protein